MTKRKWIKRANGLWTSYDPVCRRQRLRKVEKAVIEGIHARFDALMERRALAVQ